VGRELNFGLHIVVGCAYMVIIVSVFVTCDRSQE
jgi:hypothetical protein